MFGFNFRSLFQVKTPICKMVLVSLIIFIWGLRSHPEEALSWNERWGCKNESPLAGQTHAPTCLQQTLTNLLRESMWRRKACLKMCIHSGKICEESIRHRPPRTPPLNPPRSPLLRGRFGIEIGSNQEIDVESTSNRCRIDP